MNKLVGFQNIGTLTFTPGDLTTVVGNFSLLLITTLFGFGLLLNNRRRHGHGLTASWVGKQTTDMSSEPVRLMPIKAVKYSASELDCLHQSGQGASLSSHVDITSHGLKREIPGRLRFKRSRDKATRGLYLTYLLLALGPLLGSLLTLLALGSLMPLPTVPPKSPSLLSHD